MTSPTKWGTTSSPSNSANQRHRSQLGWPILRRPRGRNYGAGATTDTVIWAWNYRLTIHPQAVDLGPGMVALGVTGQSNTCPSWCQIRVNLGHGDLRDPRQGDTSHAGDQPRETGSSLPFVDLGTSRYATDITLGEFFACAR